MNTDIIQERAAVCDGIDRLLKWYRAPRKPLEEPEGIVSWYDVQHFSPLNRLLLEYVHEVMDAVTHDDPRVNTVPMMQVMTTLETVVALIKEGQSDEIWPLLKATGINLH